jgi:hypothetical protein
VAVRAILATTAGQFALGYEYSSIRRAGFRAFRAFLNDADVGAREAPMRYRSVLVILFAVLAFTTATGLARADVCIGIDQSRDTLTEPDRAASLILLAKQFELEGEHVAPEGCTATYTVSHVKFGDTITVTLAGPGGQRQGMALGMNDVPALYSQLVRALLSGQAVGAMSVVDRTNVTAVQAAPLRVQSDSMWYARLGYGGAFGSHLPAGPATGFGIRRELDSFALDVSFLNLQTTSSHGSYYGGGNSYYSRGSGMSGSWLKLEALRYLDPRSNASFYLGGGASWGGVSGSDGNKSWSGSGLQGELTAGYEMLRAANIRVFVQTDVVLPFYSSTAETYAWPAPVTTERHYTPSLAASFGLGWGHSGKARRP